MSLVGIVSEKKEEHFIHNVIQNLPQETIILLNEKTIENIKNVHFDTILIKEFNHNIMKKIQELAKLLNQAKYVIINTDISENLSMLKEIDTMVITFGFNQKSTITASSVKEDNVLICVQRTIQTIEKKEIEPQEISIERYNEKVDIYGIMGISALSFLYGKMQVKLEK